MIKVVCAILEQFDRVLVTQRSERMQEPLLWEFPGGKLEPGEEEEECLAREIWEELSLRIQPILRLQPVIYAFPDKDIELIPYICTYQSGVIQLSEHKAYQWAHPQDLLSYSWCPPDIPVAKDYLRTKGAAS
ncbi:(deoxy)nucleoside triphosphate pyrophosphohydrolase [Pontibacter rugosus]|uniref:8-oxo-dGTP diphosphatase n=1 Tax=Pontibacter rugosus TaxID=1745966 RepID=A0ABW3SP99_9BACT